MRCGPCVFLLILIIFTLLPQGARAGGFFKPSISYLIDTSENGPSQTDTKRQMIDLSAGYISEKGWLFYYQYSNEKKDVTSVSQSQFIPAASLKSTVTYTRTGTGPGIGWKTSKETGPFVMATYFMQNELTYSSISATGTGYELDLGYLYDMRKISLTLQLSYRHFDYTDSKPKGAILSPNSQTNLDPEFGLFLWF